MRKMILLQMLLVAFLGYNPVLSVDKVRLASGEWAPFSSKNMAHYGLASHIVSEAFALQNIEVEYGFFPWKRSYEYARMGLWNGTLIWARRAERENQFLFSDVVLNLEQVFFHLKTFKFEWQDFNDLSQYKIGGTIGYNYGADFMNAEKSGLIFVERVPKDVQNLNKLLAGRIDAFAAVIDVGYYLLNTHFSQDDSKKFTYHSKPISAQDPHYLLLSKNVKESEKLIGLFNEGLKQLKKSGRFDELIEEFRKGIHSRKVISIDRPNGTE